MEKRTTKKRSLNAKSVAKEVSEHIRKGKKVNLGKILINNGYSEQTSKAPQRVTETKTYQEEIKPFLDKIIKERNRIIAAMEIKNLDEVEYQKLGNVLENLTHQIQLLSGGATENINILDNDKFSNITKREARISKDSRN